MIKQRTFIVCSGYVGLFIRGGQEPKENYPAEEFVKNCPGPCEVEIVPNCDHFYVGAEDKVWKIVKAWLKKTVG